MSGGFGGRGGRIALREDTRSGDEEIPEEERYSFRAAMRKLLLASENARRNEGQQETLPGRVNVKDFCPGIGRCIETALDPSACEGCSERRYQVYSEAPTERWNNAIALTLWLDAKFMAGWRPSDLNALSPEEWEMREILVIERNWMERQVMDRERQKMKKPSDL